MYVKLKSETKQIIAWNRLLFLFKIEQLPKFLYFRHIGAIFKHFCFNYNIDHLESCVICLQIFPISFRSNLVSVSDKGKTGYILQTG